MTQKKRKKLFDRAVARKRLRATRKGWEQNPAGMVDGESTPPSWKNPERPAPKVAVNPYKGRGHVRERTARALRNGKIQKKAAA